MNIIIAINDSYAFPATVMLTSLYANNPGEEMKVLVLNRGLEDYSIELMNSRLGDRFDLRFVNAAEDLGEELYISGHVSLDTYLRLFAYKYYESGTDRALYIDSDMIVTGSLSKLYNMDFEDNYLIACEDSLISGKRRDVYDQLDLPYSYKYFNAGTLLMNIAKWQADKHLDSKIKAYIEMHGNSFQFHDQDILNGFFRDKCMILAPGIYNCFVTDIINEREARNAVRNCAVLHYSDHWKPWNDDYVGYLADEFWKYARMAGFEDEYQSFEERSSKYNTLARRGNLNCRRFVRRIVPKRR